MNIIVFPNNKGSAYSIQWNRWYHYILVGLIVLSVATGLLSCGYYFGKLIAQDSEGADWRRKIVVRHQQMENDRELAEAHIDALVERFGVLQAHINRLDALGSRLVKLADLDAAEFDFSSVPGVGGPDQPSGIVLGGANDITGALNDLAMQLEHRESQLRVLSQLIMSRNLDEEVFPAGWPIKKGWISSPYGKRKNPFSGDSEFHKGIDFAGKAGSEVIAVAGGVVTWAGKRHGYGRLVQIDHGNRLVTRYGHNSKMGVKVGDVVKKGQVIAKMGSTGRSTGPHVHFEVIKNGKKINPYKFIKASK
jgi:murein DD-endopeptidase MepM/ murein hydrolase activator NlpD